MKLSMQVKVKSNFEKSLTFLITPSKSEMAMLVLLQSFSLQNGYDENVRKGMREIFQIAGKTIIIQVHNK